MTPSQIEDDENRRKFVSWVPPTHETKIIKILISFTHYFIEKKKSKFLVFRI